MWDKGQYQAKKDEFGTWTLTIPAVDGKPVIPHGSKMKAHLVLSTGEHADRIPAWSTYSI